MHPFQRLTSGRSSLSKTLRFINCDKLIEEARKNAGFKLTDSWLPRIKLMLLRFRAGR